MMSYIHTCNKMSDSHTTKYEWLTCGLCEEKFSTICSLHQHMAGHSLGSSYHYDDIIKVAFPKYDSTCASTQTDDLQTNYFKNILFARSVRFSGDKEDMTENVETIETIEDGDRHGKSRNNVDNSLTNRLEMNNKGIGSFSDSDYSRRIGISEDLSNEENAYSTRIHRLTDKGMNLSMRDKTQNKFENIFPKRKRNLEGMHLGNSGKHEIHTTGTKENDAEFKSDIEFAENGKSILGNLVDKKQTSVDNSKSLKTKLHLILSRSESDRKLTAEKTDGKVNKMQDKEKTDKHEMIRDNQIPNSANFSIENGKVKSEVETSSCVDNEDVVEDLNDNIENEALSFKEKEYFYGKIVSSDYLIERGKPVGVFCRGEKDDSNQVFVGKTWLPFSVSKGKSESLVKKDREGGESLKGIYEIDRDVEEVDNFRDEKRFIQKPKFNCMKCDRSFKHKHHFEDHMNKHAGLKPYMCEYCGKAYTKKWSLQIHEKHVHSDRSKWLMCKICNEKSFPTLARLRMHENTHATDYTQLCNICDKSYKSLNLLKAHVKYAHNSKSYRCKNCKRSFDTMEERNAHQSEKHPSEIKCMTCGRLFTSIKSKQRHEKIHLGVKPHECHICRRRFLQKTPFWVHMEKHHDLTKADLVRLFPEKHGNRSNSQLMYTDNKDGQSSRQADGYSTGDNDLIVDTSEETLEKHIGDDL